MAGRPFFKAGAAVLAALLLMTCTSCSFGNQVKGNNALSNGNGTVVQPYSTNASPLPTGPAIPHSSPADSPAPANTAMPNAKKNYSAYPPMVIDQNKQYSAVIETNRGNLTLQLFAKDVPKAVNNFVFLARDGFYDGLTFHRVVPNFVVQGGDPLGNGYGGPGYTFGNEVTGHSHVAGALSMANTGQPNSNGSQFFICLTDQKQLDGGYSVFGQLTEGMDVLKKIRQGDVMQKVTITEK